MIKKAHKYEALDGIRGIAALMVIFYHYSLPFFDPVGVFRGQFFISTSYAFVDLFFVLSGFVIALNYNQKINSWLALKHYMAKRFARLYPLLAFTVLIYMGLKAYALIAGFEFDTDNYGWGDYFIDIVEPLTFANSTPLISTSAGMNPPSWSISAEMIAYLLFGLITWLNLRKWPYYLFVFLSIGFMFYNNRFMYTADFGFVRGILGFSIGVLAFEAHRNRPLFQKKYHEWVFLILLIISFYLIHEATTELMNLLLVPLYFYGILVFVNESGQISRFLKTPVMQFLGKISYSVYLLHFIILWVFYQISWRLLALEPNAWLGYAGIILVIGLVVLCAHFSYKCIEQPGTKLIRDKLKANE